MVFRDFPSCKPLQGSNYHRLRPLEKNHTKKPTVGFLLFANCRKVVSMMKYKNISGKQKTGWACSEATPSQFVAADVSRRSGRGRADCGGRDPLWTTDQSGMVILNPATLVGSYGAACACRAKSLICRIGLLQVVDFHDFSGYFSWCLRCMFAALLKFPKVQKQLTQVVDFHESFRYF